MIASYRVIVARVEALPDLVNRAISTGWQPHGSAVVIGERLAQPMVTADNPPSPYAESP